jgi:hypothetical protein
MMRRGITTFLIITTILAGVKISHAGEQGHYYPGVLGIRDLVLPPKGLYFAAYNFLYFARSFKDPDGKDVKQISRTVNGSRTVNVNGTNIGINFAGNITADVDVEVDSQVSFLTFIWVPGIKILGADYALAIAPSVGHQRIEIEADLRAGATLSAGPITRTATVARRVRIEDEEEGFGDLLFQPLTLGWHGEGYDVTLGYAFYAPTGAYDEGRLANVGLGFWTHQWQGATYCYLDKNKATALMFMTTYEFHSKKYDKDVTPGQNMTIEYGISQYLHERVEIGVTGYHQWQISRDHGHYTSRKDVYDRINGLGGQLTLWPVKQKLAVVGKVNWEYGARHRFEGISAVFNATYIF